MAHPDNARSALAAHLSQALSWKDAHADFDRALAGLPPELRGVRPPNMPYSAWEILEHIRIAQHDILDFCVNADYHEMHWPDDYWPASPAPPTPTAWDESVAAYKRDLNALQKLAHDTGYDLFAAVPHGQGQTYLRELILVVDHTAYHVGELVALRRMLGAWS